MKKKNINPEEAATLRQKAEERLNTSTSLSAKIKSFSEAGALKLIHELQVHQIELEMQNEELIIAKQRIEVLANKKYKELYDFAPSGYLSISKEGDILELNFAAATMLGKERSKLINNPFALFVSQETRADFNLFIQKVFTSRTKKNCEVVIATKDNYALAGPIDVSIAGLLSANDEYCLLTLADITEQKKAEQEIFKAKVKAEESEEKYNITENDLLKAQSVARLGNWKWDLKTQEVIWSIEMFQVFGIDKNSYTGRLSDVIEKVIHPDDLHIVLPTNAPKIAEKKPIEYRIIMPDKSIRYIQAEAGETILDDNGNPLFLTGIAQDITERKLTEAELIKAKAKAEESENRYSELLNNLETGIVVHSIDSSIIQCNHRSSVLLGLSEDQMKGKAATDPHWKFIYEDNTPIPLDEYPIMQILNHKKAIKNQITGVCKAGNEITWLTINGFPYLNENGDLKEIVISFNDITERKNADEKLRKSEAIKNTMVSNIGDVIVIIDQNGINQFKSPNITKLFGWKPEELIGKSTWDTVHPDDLEAAQKFIATIAKEPNATGTTEVRYKRKDGEYVWIEISIINLLHDKDIQGILGNFCDITERKQAEQIRQQLDITRKTVMFKKNFLANMSHEIRTPLTGVLGMTDILNQTQLSEEQQDYLNIIKTSGENLSEIINQVLDYSKIEAGKVSLNPVAFQFSSIIGDTVNLYKNSLKSGVKLLAHSNPQIPPFIKADRFRLTQIINNLVSNALKFTRNGTVEILSRLESSHPEDKKIVIRIEVKDTGIGIPDSLQGQLFTPFSQIDNADTRKYEGTGLGLSICKQLIEMMGGTIGLKSEHGKGSNFWFTFPASVAEQQTTPEADYTGILSQKNLHILLAEDKVVNQKVIKVMLTSLGQTVTIACNGKRAIELYQPGKFDLILMDIQMPVMDGVTATQKLKEKYDDLPPIVGLSANAFEGDREKYMALGMDEYLTKPVKKDDFEELIRKVIL